MTLSSLPHFAPDSLMLVIAPKGHFALHALHAPHVPCAGVKEAEHVSDAEAVSRDDGIVAGDDKGALVSEGPVGNMAAMQPAKAGFRRVLNYLQILVLVLLVLSEVCL